MKSPLRTAPAAVPFGRSCIVLDVRTDLEHEEVSLKDRHHHIPLDQLDVPKFLQDNKIDAASPVYVLCRSGKRATRAAEAFIAAGHENVHVVEGGIDACQTAGISVRTGQVISLERQVRIAAGTLVVLGIALGLYITPWFYGLAAFVGAGLVFAGVTDTCGMGLLLARAPWNKGPAQSCDTGSACTATSACANNTPAIKMPAGAIFYSPAGSAPVGATTATTAKTKSATGSCS